LNIGEYMENIKPGTYSLQVCDSNENGIYEQQFSFKGPALSIISCDQRWWRNSDYYSLIGLELSVSNTGDAPSYPYYAKISSGSKEVTGLVLPYTVLPGSTKTIYSYIYHENTFESDTFTVEILDEDKDILASNSFSFDITNSVTSKSYDNGALDSERLTIPYPDFLYRYYLGLDRFYVEDYSAFVFDKYDESYIDLLLKLIISTVDYGEFKFNLKTDVQKVEYIASFVQGLDYKKDSGSDDSYEYPMFPVETLFNGVAGGGDCEDKAMLTANLLNNLGYEVALFRLPKHMAVGVKLGEEAVKGDYYVEDYDFLETTMPGNKCGHISNDDYKSPSDLSVYPIEDRAFLIHEWKNGVITTYKNTKDGDLVKAIAYTTNMGNKTAENIIVEGLFFSEDIGIEFSSKKIVIPELKPGDRKKTVITCVIPESIITKFQTRVYLDGVIVDDETSKDFFP